MKAVKSKLKCIDDGLLQLLNKIRADRITLCGNLLRHIVARNAQKSPQYRACIDIEPYRSESGYGALVANEFAIH
jgi:hypothetical protein